MSRSVATNRVDNVRFSEKCTAIDAIFVVDPRGTALGCGAE